MESNSNELLAAIGLSRSELVASLNHYAGKFAKQTVTLSTERRKLISEQIRTTEIFLKSSPVRERAKLSADVAYLAQKVR